MEINLLFAVFFSPFLITREKSPLKLTEATEGSEGERRQHGLWNHLSVRRTETNGRRGHSSPRIPPHAPGAQAENQRLHTDPERREEPPPTPPHARSLQLRTPVRATAPGTPPPTTLSAEVTAVRTRRPGNPPSQRQGCSSHTARLRCPSSAPHGHTPAPGRGARGREEPPLWAAPSCSLLRRGAAALCPARR